MKKIAINNIKQKGFDSKAQMRFLLQMARKYPEKYNFVFDIIREHGVPSTDKVDPAYWAPPYNISPETPSYVYTGGKTSNMDKLEKIVKTAYVNHIVRLFEGKSSKFSSIEEALTDFSDRLGLTNLEMDGLTKEAMKKIAQLNLTKLEEDGITDPKAIEFMSRSKNKHTKDSPSPYSLNTEKGKKLVEKLREKKKMMTPEFEEGDQANEFGDNATSDGSGASFVASLQVERLERYAQEKGKILNLFPSKENITQLQEELGGSKDPEAYKAARTGYKFTRMNSDEFPIPGEPIKGTLFQFVSPKLKLMEMLNKDLREQLNMEMPIKGWIQYLQSEPFQGSKSLISNLEKIERQLYGTETEQPALIDVTDTRQRVKQMGKLINWFPKSYRRQILNMIAQGRYKHLHSDISDKVHSNIFASNYRKASFPVMQSFDSHTTLEIPHTERLADVLDKDEYSTEELKGVLDAAGIKYEEKPASKESSQFQVGDRTITVNHGSNSKYQPLVYKGKPLSSFSQKEKLLEKLNDHVMTAVQTDKPLVYAPQPDGTQKPMYLSDLNKGNFKYKDYTASKVEHVDEEGNVIEVDNPYGGLQMSYQGEYKPAEPSMTGRLPGLSKSRPKPSGESTEKKQTDLENLLEQFRKKKESSLKIAEAAPVWIGDRGKTYASEAQMAQAFVSETVAELQDEIVNEAVNQYMAEFGDEEIEMPQEQPQQQMQPMQEPQMQQELPLAAHNLSKLKEIYAKTKSKNLRNIISKIHGRR